MNDDIKKALQTLENGGIICYPTDTVWGLGCDATNVQAVEKLYAIKKSPNGHNKCILLDNAGKIPGYLEELPDVAYDLFETTTSPLTLILPGAKNLASNLVAEDGTIGIQIVDHLWCQRVLQRFKRPIVFTSASFTDNPTPASFEQINESLLQSVDYTAESFRDEVLEGKPSSIIKLGPGGEVKIIRE